MTWLSQGVACDGDGCDAFHRGPTFPSSAAASTWAAAFADGWTITGSPREAAPREHLCRGCYVARAGAETHARLHTT